MTDDPRIEAAAKIIGPALHGWHDGFDEGGCPDCQDVARDALAAADAVDPLRRTPDPACAPAATTAQPQPGSLVQPFLRRGPMTDRLHWSHPAYATAVTGSRPPCAPDHPWARIPARDLIRGVCPVCMGALDGEKAARTLRALCLIGKRDD